MIFQLSSFTLLLLATYLVFLIHAEQHSNHHSSAHLSVDNAPSNLFKLRGIRRTPAVPATTWDDAFDETFYVAIAAFRDIECVLSIRDMMRKAANPRRMYLGIIEQNEHGDPTCVPDEFYECNNPDFCPLDNIRRRRTVSRNGKGPCYGRYISMLLYRGENYYMMMDSHNQFIRHWDTKSINQLHRSRSTRPVVSHYPNSWDKTEVLFTNIKKENQDNLVKSSLEAPGNVIVMCNGHFMPMGYIRMDGMWMVRTIEPRNQPFSAGGYLFGDAILVHDVPFDPHLDFLFDGEEILYSARMFTHGYDIQTPGESVLQHDYNRHKGIRYWTIQNQIPNNQGWHQEVAASQQRARYMMQIPKENATHGEIFVDPNADKNPRVRREFDKYTTGKRRTMAEYNWFAKMDPPKRKAGNDLCRFIEHETSVKSGK